VNSTGCYILDPRTRDLFLEMKPEFKLWYETMKQRPAVEHMLRVGIASLAAP